MSDRSVKIVCFAEEDWNLTGKRVQHMMSELSRRDEVRAVLYVNPPVSHSVTDLLRRQYEPGWSTLPVEFYNRTLLGLAQRVDDRVCTYTGSNKVIPLSRFEFLRQGGHVSDINRRIYLSRVLVQWRRLPGETAIVWGSHPIYGPEVACFPGTDMLIYDWMDDWEQFKSLPTKDSQTLRALTDRLARRADIVLTVSERLHRRATTLNANAFLVANGTHFEHFATLSNLPCEAVVRIPRPRLGYVGRIGDRIDFSLLERLACSRPGWSVVLVGPVWDNVQADADRLRRHANVHFLGAHPYDELPRIVTAFDVCLIPHTVDLLTASMDPIKLYDYLATGKPVVTTDVAGVERFLDVLYLAHSPEEFMAQVGAALEESEPGLAERRREYARQNSWEARAEQVWGIIDAVLSRASDNRSGPSRVGA